uniref:Uncharacterized protein n=1 Tax=Globisporangium ultimum (strain ATCC 200006 / CBS 805.95 / DAOM BR144) TaxID=431595 RepID=K3WT91_GLOUD
MQESLLKKVLVLIQHHRNQQQAMQQVLKQQETAKKTTTQPRPILIYHLYHYASGLATLQSRQRKRIAMCEEVETTMRSRMSALVQTMMT